MTTATEFTPFPIMKTSVDPNTGWHTFETEHTRVMVNPEKISALGYIGKQSKHRFHYSFNTTEKMQKYITDFINRVHSNTEADKKRKEARKKEAAEFQKELKVGHIFRSSWGYEQTNVDFYQVTEIKGSFMILRAIHQAPVDGSYGHDSCYVVPVKDSFIDSDPIRKKIQTHLNIDSVRFASTWGGEPAYKSWYY